MDVERETVAARREPGMHEKPISQDKQGAPDAGRYFRYMAEFVGFTPDDAATIRQTRPIIEKHLPDIVSKFYTHLLRYPPTRKVFLKKDGSVDQEYVELRMRHLTNFWLRTASGEFDDNYARYVDYVGRAHTSHGADPHIYIAERYVIGQVGFVQHAISDVIARELRESNPDLEFRAVEAWDKLMMVLLELLSRAYGNEREAETFDPLVAVDQAAVAQLAQEAVQQEVGQAQPTERRKVVVARVQDIPEGERKLVQVGPLSIGLFRHEGTWIALRNSCLHRGGPVATGCLENGVLTCPWHGFQYQLPSGQLLVDPSARLETYPVVEEDGQVVLLVPESIAAQHMETVLAPAKLKRNEFPAAELAPGMTRLAWVDSESVAVYNVDGVLYATQEACTHFDGPLSEGALEGCIIECPLHGSRFNVQTGAVVEGPATDSLRVYRVMMEDGIARVEKMGPGDA
jgi:nitrite reductase/ring-hydroxylating ferredoxin subunit/hemoglobin-like flavoprotein